MTYIFDSSAVLRYLDREAGWDRVRTILRRSKLEESTLLIPAVQWGETVGNICRRDPERDAELIIAKLRIIGFRPVPITPEQAVRAALIRIAHRLPYADAMLAAVAIDLSDTILITADFDFKAVQHLISIEFLPPKSSTP